VKLSSILLCYILRVNGVISISLYLEMLHETVIKLDANAHVLSLQSGSIIFALALASETVALDSVLLKSL